MLCEFHTKAMVRTPMQASDEAFYSLLGKEFQRAELAEVVGL